MFITWLNIVALLVPKGKRNSENKLDLNERTIVCLLDKRFEELCCQDQEDRMCNSCVMILNTLFDIRYVRNLLFKGYCYEKLDDYKQEGRVQDET